MSELRRAESRASVVFGAPGSSMMSLRDVPRRVSIALHTDIPLYGSCSGKRLVSR